MKAQFKAGCANRTNRNTRWRRRYARQPQWRHGRELAVVAVATAGQVVLRGHPATVATPGHVRQRLDCVSHVRVLVHMPLAFPNGIEPGRAWDLEPELAPAPAQTSAQKMSLNPAQRGLGIARLQEPFLLSRRHGLQIGTGLAAASTAGGFGFGLTPRRGLGTHRRSHKAPSEHHDTELAWQDNAEAGRRQVMDLKRNRSATQAGL